MYATAYRPDTKQCRQSVFVFSLLHRYKLPTNIVGCRFATYAYAQGGYESTR